MSWFWTNYPLNKHDDKDQLSPPHTVLSIPLVVVDSLIYFLVNETSSHPAYTKKFIVIHQKLLEF